MNRWKKCLQCWIPVSKKNEKKSVIRNVEGTEVEGHDVTTSLPPHDLPAQSVQTPVRRMSSAAVSSVDDSLLWTLPPTDNSTEASDNYIPLDECFSGSRSAKQPTLPRLAQRDIHLLDLVPPSPCSLTDNFRSLSGMPEVYASTSCKAAHGTSRGSSVSSAGFPTRGGDCVNRSRQVTPQFLKRDLNCAEMDDAIFSDDGPGADRPTKANFRNNNAFHGGKNGHLVSNRSDTRATRTSVSSEKSVVEQRLCYVPHRATDHPSWLHYCNIHSNDAEKTFPPPYARADSSEKSVRDTTNVFPDSGDARELERPGRVVDEPQIHSQESLKILHMTPPVPPQNNRVKGHRYINARDGPCAVHRSVEGKNSFSSSHGYSEEVSPRSSLSHSVTNDGDVYYNLVPTTGSPSKSVNGASTGLPPPPPFRSSKKQQKARPALHHSNHHRQSPDPVVLPMRRSSRNTDDSSSSTDDESIGDRSTTNSNLSLSKSINSSLLKSFTAVLPAPCHQPTGVEYLQLALDEPGTSFTRPPSGTVHRSQNSTIDYIEIDPCRTKALSDTKKQLENNRHNFRTYL